ncbi:MAG: metallophosphoesterase [Geodermatophilaceae bacterium]|nr:metallophosphoesterase [Geodermatophilaceae bacterium]MDQ3454716.1 metallophosphoesterase [Actinomycetota bacterium]
MRKRGRRLTDDGTLWAISDLHVNHPENRSLVEQVRARSEHDWLIVAGDVAEQADEVEDCLGRLRETFARVLWVPGNHELWTDPRDPAALRGVARYDDLVERCRRIGVCTPEDEYPIWTGPGGPVRVAGLFTLYDYSFLAPATSDVASSLAAAYASGVVCSDENLLPADPYPSRADWCTARVAGTRARLDACTDGLPFVLVNHYPLVREPTRVLRYPEFAQWCGTEQTADWHRRYPVAAVVYGHLHIPRTTWYDGVRFEEVSLGYPREWGRAGHRPGLLQQILPPGGRT